MICASILALLLVFAGLTATIRPASAAEGDPQYLSVEKTVAPEQVSPGQPFTYTISVTCAEASCLNATLDDALPAEFAGYTVQNVNYAPSAINVPRDIEWTVDGTSSGTRPNTVTADTALHVDFTGTVFSPAGVGLEEGITFSVTITLQVPDDMPPGTQQVTNTAETAADNSAPDRDSATITILTPEIIDVDVTKAWFPTSQSFSPGAASTIDLGVINASNGPVERLVIQEPQTALGGVSALDASNPFTITDFTGFGSSTLPAGADQVQVDLYLQQADGTWAWVPGPPSAAVELPDDVDPADVGGIRLTYTGAAIEEGATGTISLGLAQRATQRDTDADLSVATQRVDNVAQGTASVEGRDPVDDTATASYEVIPASINTAVVKNITPGRLAAGDTATARIVGTNSSDVGVNSLTITDLDYFDADVAFGGFTAAPTWPADAATGTLIYHPLDGSDPIEVALANDGSIPDAPDVLISGFEIVFAAPDGAIAPGSSTALDFTIVTTEDAIADGSDTRETTNTATSTVVAQNGVEATQSDDAGLILLEPAIDVTLTKSILPGSPVLPGQTVVTQLASNLKTTSDYITATQIVVEDAWSDATGEFWDAFDLDSIAPTQVPGGASLTIQVRGADGSWITLTDFPAQPDAHAISLSNDEIQALLPGGVDVSDLTGIRFTFDKPDGFASNTTVTPYVVSEARYDLRTGDPVVPGEDQPVGFENLATTSGAGQTESGTPLEDEDEKTATGTIETQVGSGTVGIDKRWNQPTVDAQSGQTRTTTLSWRVSQGLSGVTITDPAPSTPMGAPGAVEGTAFDTFDLSRINIVNADSTPFSNGWFLRYDTITAVELFRGGMWETLGVPDGGWIQNGAFVGYVLGDEQRADTTGVRIVLAENTDARIAAGQIGENYDPYAPAAGSGIAASSASRSFDLTWQIREKKRSDSAWVTAETDFNHADAGVVNNDVRLDATPIAGGAPVSDRDSHTIIVIDQPPGVGVTKTVSNPGPLYVPMEATTDADSYPTTTFSLQARNNSTAKASYIRVTDPPVCLDGEGIDSCQSEATAAGAVEDPFSADIDWLAGAGQGNPFDRFDLKKVTISAANTAQVDLAASVVWLLRYDGTDYSTEQTTAAAVNAASAADLADVVGVSVTFQGADPATTGGTITTTNRLNVVLDAQLRTTVRSSGDSQLVGANHTVDVTNRVFAQSYDPILADGTATGDLDDVDVTLTGGDINVGPTKTIAPNALTEPTRHDPVTVTIGADQGTTPVSTLPAAEVRLTDDLESSPDFWNSFDFTGLGAINAPAGADQVIVAVYGPFGEDGALEWVTPAAAPIADAAVPVGADQYGDIQGIHLEFSRADGAFFSTGFPAPAWSTTTAFTVQLRDAYRDSGDAIDLEDRPTIQNQVVVVADRLNGEASAAKASTASVAASPGTFQLDVHKTVNDGISRAANVGDPVPWDLTFTNTGTGYLSITELRDVLPESLVYLGDDPVYTPSEGGLLPAPESLATDGDDLVFTWADGARMLPGESFSIRVILELQPGLRTGQRATNAFTVSTVETLAQCTDTGTPTALTDDWQNDPTTCGTTEYVQPSEANNLFVVKGVRGERDGAINPNNPAAVCQQNLAATGGAYYRTPCAANSQVGGTDDWVLRATNGGTNPLQQVVLFDQLPVAGDRLLLSGGTRGSVYRPQLLPGAQVSTSGSPVTTVFEATLSPDICVGTYGNLESQEACVQNGEVWVAASSLSDADWANVTGLRTTLDFGTTGLAPGGYVDITYSTRNTVATEADPSGAPSAVPATDSFAWNQFGAKFRFQGETAFRKIAPNRVGVHLLFGSIEFSKEITGDAAGYAPDEFLFDVVCTIDGATLDMGEHAVVELNSANEHTQRIDGIPFGASCDVAEQGAIGQFGETSRYGTPVTLVVEAENSQGAIPEDQMAIIENEYDYSGLSVTKTVDTDASEGEFGPFDFTLVCTTAIGTPVVFDGDATELAFTLSGGETFTAPENTIPARATCVIGEVDSADADGIVIVGDNVTDNGDGTASVLVGTSDATVEFTNGFDSGVLTVSKVVDGEGAALYGAGPFDFTAVCTYRGQTLLDVEFVLDANAQRTFGTYPTGTECVVTETATGGATRTAIDPEDGTVVISAEEDATNAVTATNSFDLTSIRVDKTIAGEAAAFGEDEFFVDVVCTVRGIDVPLGADAVLSLNSANAFSARVNGIPTGADCTVTEQGEIGEYGETARAGTPADIDVEIVVGADEEVPAEQAVELVNEYTYSGLSVTKTVDTEASEGEFGPFDFTLSCTSQSGIPVTFDGDVADFAFSLEADETFTVPSNTIPANSTCLIAEVDSAAANSITVRSDAVTDLGDGRASVEVGAEPVSVEYTNVFDSGLLTIEKQIDGAGAELYGAGPFAFTAVCTYRDQTLLDASFALSAGEETSYGAFPTGTECIVEETNAAGATTTSYAPNSIVVITAAETGATQVTVTNTFSLSAVEIRKSITGGAAGYAASEFLADVVCTIGGTAIDLGDSAVVALNAGNGYAQRVDGIPTGATCEATEQGAIGDFGETSRPVTNAVVTVDEVAGDEVPDAQVAELVNDYAFSGLSVTKRVDAAADAEYGPFDFTLVCTSATGVPVTFDGGAAELAFALSGDETFTAPEETIPALASCVVTEVGATGEGVVVVGDNVTDNRDGSAVVRVGVAPAEVEFTNSFEAGVLVVQKIVDGAGANHYGTGEFDFTAVCTYDGQTLLDESFELAGGDTRSFGPYPTNTSCVVEETDAGDATRTALDPSDGIVVLGADAVATVTATNTFDVASITVTKKVTGDLDASGARGVFAVELQCTEGSVALTIPAGAVRELRVEGEYRATFANLPAGADCVIVETDAGGAVRTTIVVVAADGSTTAVDGASAEVVAVGDVQVEITNEFVKDLPKTGLAISPLVWAAIPLLLFAGLALLLISTRRRREEV